MTGCGLGRGRRRGWADSCVCGRPPPRPSVSFVFFRIPSDPPRQRRCVAAAGRRCTLRRETGRGGRGSPRRRCARRECALRPRWRAPQTSSSRPPPAPAPTCLGGAHPPPGARPSASPPPRAATLRIASAGVAGSENALRGRVGEVRRLRYRVLHDFQHARRLRPRRPASGGAGGAGGGGRSARLAAASRCSIWLYRACSGSESRSDSGLRPPWRPRQPADPKNRPSRRPGEKHCSSFYTSCTNVEFVQDQGLLSVSCEGRRHSSTLVLDGDAVLTEFLI